MIPSPSSCFVLLSDLSWYYKYITHFMNFQLKIYLIPYIIDTSADKTPVGLYAPIWPDHISLQMQPDLLKIVSDLHLHHIRFLRKDFFMKLTKAEKIWLTFVIIFFFLYNMPFFPPYNHPRATTIHALLTIAPLWFCVYLGLARMCRKFKLKKGDRSDPGPAQPNDTKRSASLAQNGQIMHKDHKEDPSC